MAAEFVGGAFVSASFQVLFERLASEDVLDFIRGKNLTNGLIKKLKIMLLSANIVLDDAEEKQITSPMVRAWLDELKEATYDAQDLAYEIESEALRLKLMESGDGLERLRSKALKLVSISLGTMFDKAVENKLAVMLDRFESILMQKDVLGLRHCVRSRSSLRLPLSLVEESGVYGRSDDKEAIVNLLMSDNVGGDTISVIPIVGMGGIGKTTLAQLVYNDDGVSKYFDLKAWVTVSDEFEVFGLTKRMLEAMNSRVFDVHDPYQLQIRLKESLRGKKFLFVLDDVWNENYGHWDALRSLFELGARGSKIILTTRCLSIASMVCSIQIYHLRTISDEDGWLLFAKHAFGSEVDRLANPDLEVIGRKILQKCKGLPLAVKSLGGLLRYQLNPGKWETVLKSDIWDLPKEDNSILPALWLSYYYLPSHLKRCFAYCSIFPKDYEFEKNELVLLWMGEDLLQPQRNKTIEEVGAEYFDNLISRSLFQRSSSKQQCYTIHDLVSDLATFVSGEFSVRLGDNDFPVTARTRHLSFVAKEAVDKRKLEALSEAKCLRTFLGLGWEKEKQPFYLGMLVHLKCLRVLSLSCFPIIELPETIGNLKNLRFLNLSSTEIRDIPASVCTLHNLQTLLLAFCTNLTQLPTNIGSLIHLRHMDISGTPLTEMPIQLSKLKDLQKLSCFVLGKDSGSRIKMLKELKQLHGELVISGLENVEDVNDMAEANLKDKKYISHLSLQWEGKADDSHKEKQVLDYLRPHTNLKRLSIDCYRGTKFPNWLGDHSFCNVVMVYLHRCKNCCLLPPLGQLPSLQDLHICMFDGVVRIGEEFYSNGNSPTKPFKSLKALVFSHMLEWREWSFNGHDNKSAVFPLLKDLTLRDCPKLNVDLTDDHFMSLMSLSISECQNLNCIEGLPSSLNSLSVSDCGKLIPSCLNWDMQRLRSLRHLKIMDYKEVLDSFPNEGVLLPSSLTHLWIINLPNLRALNGKAFQCHQSLEELRIHGCSQLSCLPDEGLPSSLNYFSLYFCHSLNKRCQRQDGEDWPKISHVGRVCINGKFV